MSDQPAEGGIPTYEWRTAPAHLRTRRQLSAEGLRPNGQDIAAKVHREFRGGPVTAYLYDINLAAAKRQATPAQLAALEKATRERQLRAAERHGVDRAEFDHVNDPGPAWTDSSPVLRASVPGHAFTGLIGAARDRDEWER
ncbi:RRQRL motif-containing zinc-binding protein [Nocardia altamirensis]|uniref:RRQRL motif-containing zinc-binding protein n=1 Tax=Nocardia altamirensis TaxID=472158 RepID=UPI0008406CC2|nr:RRQRL motif-containing zinc-binding protein [Nocardia altamirensis]